MAGKHKEHQEYWNPSIRYTPEEEDAIRRYVDLHGLTISGMVRRAVKESIGDSFPDNMPGKERRDYKERRENKE